MSIERAKLGPHSVGRDEPIILLGGPCVIESRDHTLRLADQIAKICRQRNMPLVFKASFDKANRSSIGSFRGPGLVDGLAILAEVHSELGLPVVSDIHSPEQAATAGEALDCIQLPAFLCRQTDLILAAARTGKCVNIKKGQFMSPEEMGNVVEKARSVGNDSILLTERGTFFGYNRLVNDMTSLRRMGKFAPVVFDATHSCQLPGGAGTTSGGNREHAPSLALAAIAAGADALFLEVHDDPENAKSDAATVYPLAELDGLIDRIKRVAEAVGRPV